MKRIAAIAAVAFGTSACVAGMAANAVGMAAAAARDEPVSNQHLQPAAREACSAQAAAYGTVRIIDVEQSSANKMIVWGTVDHGKQRRSFECGFGTSITSFKLRPIARNQ